MGATDELPSLTLKVLEKIQAELVGVRTEIVGMRTEIGGMRTEIVGMRFDLKTLSSRFDHFLEFVGRDVQDLKDRLTTVEHHLGFAKP